MTSTPPASAASRVAEIPDFPFASFAELTQALHSRVFSLGVDPVAAAEWSDKFNSALGKALVAILSVLLISSAVSSVVAALLTENYWLLIAIPIMAAAFYFSHPGSRFQKWATAGGILSVVVLMNFVLTGNQTGAALVAYAGLTFALVRAAGYINNSAFRRALLADEAAFVAAYTGGACTLQEKKTGMVYSKGR